MRFAEIGIHSNGQMSARDIERFCAIGQKSKDLLEKSMHRLGLSARAYHRILKIARTIADMEASEHILFSHIAEAIGYRRVAHNL